MPNFFQSPLLPQQPNPEPAGWNSLRAMLMQQAFQRQANPYGMNPGAQSNAAYNPLLPSGGQGRFNPYGGGYGGPGPAQQGGGGGQNGLMQMFMQFMKQRQGQRPGGFGPTQQGPGDAYAPSGTGHGLRVPGMGAPTGPSGPAGHGAPRGVGFRAPGPAQPGPGSVTPPLPTEPPNQYTPPGQLSAPAPSFDWQGHGVTAQPMKPAGQVGPIPEGPGDPYSQNLTDGNPVEQTEYDGRPDAAKMMHGHTALMRSVLPMLLKASAARHAAAGMLGGSPPTSGPAPSPTAFDGNYDGQVAVGGPGGTIATGTPGGTYTGTTAPNPIGGARPGGAIPGTTPPAFTGWGSGGSTGWTTELGYPMPNQSGGGAPGDPPTNPVPTPQTAGYDGSRIRAPFSMPHGPVGMAGSHRTAAGLNHILAGMGGANRRGMIESARVGSPHSVFDGERNEYRPMPRGPAPSTDFDGDPNDPNSIMSVGGTSTPPGTTPSGGYASPPTQVPAGVGMGNPGNYGSSAPTGSTGGGYDPFPSGAETLGNPMYPWLMPYTGQRTAPMSNEQNQALGQMGSFVGGGEGLGTGYDYLSDELGGKYIGEGDPYMQQIEQGAGGLKNIQDAQARQRIASGMAAGGNALSGARAGAEQQYQNTSDANYQQMLGQLKLQNLMQERNLQQGAAGMLPGYANTQVGGLNALMNAGAVPQQTEQSDYNRQYNDWLRQIGGMKEANQYGQNQALSLLSKGGYPGSNQPLYGESGAAGIAGLLAGLLGGGSGGGGLGGLLKQLLGGGSGGSKGGGGSSGGGGSAGGGKPGQDSSGNKPGQPGYDPTTDPGSPEYVEQIGGGSDANGLHPGDEGYDPTTDPNSADYTGSSDFGNQDMSFPGGYDYGLGGDPGSEGYYTPDPGYGDTGDYYGDGSEGG